MSYRGYFLLTALGYLTFVIYGSLVPLDFHPLSADEAIARFAHIPFLQLGIDSRADWVANLLLFIPLAYLWLGVLWRPGRTPWNAGAAFIVLVGSCVLSVAIEFVQLYFPPRTVSINDIVAESAGGVLGVATWWITAERLIRWLERWLKTRDSMSWAERALYVYLLGFYAYSVLPLDLTISPVEVYHKWSEGRVLLIPFSMTYRSASDAIYDLTADIAVWIPVAVLWRLSGKLTCGAVIWRVGATAALLEFLQLFVYSRVTDATDVLTALAGGAIGAAVGGHLNRWLDPGDIFPERSESHPKLQALWWLWAAAMLLWLATVAMVFWYPFAFYTERAIVVERLRNFASLPFESYYFGSEFRAITEVLHKILFFMPGGALLTWATLKVPKGLLRALAGACSALTVTGISLTIELGQVLMPNKVGNTTDWFLESLGGFIGGFVAWHIIARRQTSLRAQGERRKMPERSSRRTRRPGSHVHR